jgi:hypothetical protein
MSAIVLRTPGATPATDFCGVLLAGAVNPLIRTPGGRPSLVHFLDCMQALENLI